MTSPDTSTSTPTSTSGDPAKGATSAPDPTTSAPPAKPSPSNPVAAASLPKLAPGTLVTDAELESETDQRGMTKYVSDADGGHFVVGAGPSIGVVVSVDKDGVPSVAWLPDAAPYGLPLLALIS